MTIDGAASYNRADADASAQHDIDLTSRTEIPRLTLARTAFRAAADDLRATRSG